MTNNAEVSEPMSFETLSTVLKKVDSRCAGWHKIISAEQARTLNASRISSANDLPGGYLRTGSDHELSAFDMVLEGEANHHIWARGWTWRLGVTLPGNGLALR